MTGDAAPDDEADRLRRLKRRTRWQVAILEGLGAAIFIAVIFHHGFREPFTGRPSVVLSVAAAFVCVAAVAFLLWPMAFKGQDFAPGRVTLFGFLVVLLGSYVWLVAVGLILYPPRVSSWSGVVNLFTGLSRSLGGVLMGMFFFGVFTLPIGIGIAWAVAIWNNNRM